MSRISRSIQRDPGGSSNNDAWTHPSETVWPDVDTLIIVLRLLHIVTGAFWVGSIVLAVLFVEPTAKAFGATGERFFAHMLFRTGLMPILVGAATVAIAAGAALYWINSDGLRVDWITTPTGLAFTAGAGAALAAYAIALLILKPQFDRLAVLADEPFSTDGDMQGGRSDAGIDAPRVRRWSLIQVSLLVFAIAAMAVARYLP